MEGGEKKRRVSAPEGGSEKIEGGGGGGDKSGCSPRPRKGPFQMLDIDVSNRSLEVGGKGKSGELSREKLYVWGGGVLPKCDLRGGEKKKRKRGGGCQLKGGGERGTNLPKGMSIL